MEKNSTGTPEASPFDGTAWFDPIETEVWSTPRGPLHSIRTLSSCSEMPFPDENSFNIDSVIRSMAVPHRGAADCQDTAILEDCPQTDGRGSEWSVA